MYENMTVKELVEGIKAQKFTAESVMEHFIGVCNEKKDNNAVIEVFDDAIIKAKEIDERIRRGEKVGKLAGLPIAFKDNILIEGKHTSCASNFLTDFIAPYSATIVKNLVSEDAIPFARTNMDEFAMGGSCENTIYGACKNACDPTRVSGGSSGGSAVAVASGMCPVAIGSDTGGSIRQPASFNGIVGIKPTYGTVSRYGMVAFASSLDQASPFTKTVEDNEFILRIMAGKDYNDGTTIDNKFEKRKSDEPYKIGLIKEIMDMADTLPEYANFKKAIETLKENEVELVTVDIPHIKKSLACYYIIAPAEATSNLARFDGVKYSKRSKEATDLDSVYVLSRSEGFGKEVKRRIMLGNFVLSSGYFDAYYNKARKVQALIRAEFADAFTKCDAIMMPTTTGEAFKIGEKIDDPVSMYLEDLFTVPANIAGVPAISVPYAKGKNGLPLGMQFYGANETEETLYEIAEKFEKMMGGKA